MSTAGKVLVVLITLAVLVWLVLAGRVAQVNRNGNEALQKLADEMQKIENDLQDTRALIAKTRDETIATQETIDRDVTVLRSRQTDLEESRSQIVETLT